MKILHIIYTHGISGAEKHLDYLLPGLKKYGITCEVMLICPPFSEEILLGFASLLQQKGIKTTVITARRNMLISTIWKVKKYLDQNKIAIVHSHLINTDLLVSLLKQFLMPRLFIVSTKHGYNEKVLNNYSPDKFTVKRDLYYYFTRYTLKNINKNISISKSMTDVFCNLKITKEHYPVIYHGINVERPKTDTSFRKSKQQLVIAGRLEEMKGHEYLIDAMPLVLQQYPECKLLVLGNGSLKDKLVAKSRALGMENNIEFLGFQPNPYSFIANSDVIILPSIFEPFGLVYIEAHALKVPVVAFDTPAANELMINNETGYLVPKFDSRQLAEKILLLLNDPEEHKRITDNAYRQYLEKFTSDVMIENTANWYFENIKIDQP